MIGSVIENYKIVSILGEGGMGVVYKALDMKLERFVALKILSTQSANNPQFIERFKREARNQAKLTHQNIVPVYGFTDDNGILGIAMEYVEGETLEKIIYRKKRLDTLEALKILKQILDGVAYAHAKGFIHRDIKPSNIIINRDGVIKIMDFGISKSMFDKGITKTGTKIGTILYMSPEQIRAEEPTRQSDIYSIGVSFYEMLVGKTPFDFGTEYEIMEAHLKKVPARLSTNLDSVPPEIDRIVAKSLEKNVAKRYMTCEEFNEDVEDLIKKLDKTKPQGRKKVSNSDVVKYRIKLALMSIAALAVFIGLAYVLFHAISDFWPSHFKNEPKMVDTTSGYTSHPDYYVKSNWASMLSNTTFTLNGIYFVNKNFGVTVGEGGTVLMSTDGGETWKKSVFPEEITLNDVAFQNESTGFIIGERGKIFRTTDAGASWKLVNCPVTETLFRIAMLPGGTGFIVGNKGTILRTANSGETWSKIDSGTDKLLYGIGFSDAATGFIVGWNGTILKTSDNGFTWSVQSSGTDKYLRDIFFVSSSTGFVSAAGGEILKTTDKGSSWKKLSGKIYSGLVSIAFVDENHGFAVSNKGEILESKDGGNNWSVYSGGNYLSLSRLFVVPGGPVFICGFNGLILKAK